MNDNRWVSRKAKTPDVLILTERSIYNLQYSANYQGQSEMLYIYWLIYSHLRLKAIIFGGWAWLFLFCEWEK